MKIDKCFLKSGTQKFSVIDLTTNGENFNWSRRLGRYIA
ncbi:uncharacterized protein METZ01_LOCUS24222 [marine metagenome]|uniref:Uncharacterized protein n=1 Tax=marine metagenome TaxID=408172 RepID=A0A381PXQ2_9ZZZZ